MIWRARHHTLTFPRRPLIMGIVNINDDSFCGDGTLDPSIALAQAEQQLKAGADIIDFGAESARTNRGPISIQEEVDGKTAVLGDIWWKMRQFFLLGIKYRANLVSLKTATILAHWLPPPISKSLTFLTSVVLPTWVLTTSVTEK
jgi:hypothetical protein